MTTDRNAGTVTATRPPGLLERLGEWDISPMEWAKKLGAALDKMTHYLSGTSKDILNQCPANEQSFFKAQSVLMTLTACVTTTGLAPMLTAQWQLEGLMLGVVWLGLFGLILSLEVMVLNSIQNGASGWQAVALRLPVAAVLVSAQLIPSSIHMLADKLAIERQSLSLEDLQSLNAKAKSAFSITALEAKHQEAETALSKALDLQRSPTHNVNIEKAKLAIREAQANLEKHQVLMAKAKESLERARTAMQAEKGDRIPLVERYKNAQHFLAKISVREQEASSVVAKAKTELATLEKQQAENLNANVADKKQIYEQQRSLLLDSHSKLAAAEEHSRKLTEAANHANFSTQFMALLRLMSHDIAALVTILMLLFGWMVLDITPAALKAMLIRNSTYYALVNHRKASLESELKNAAATASFESALQRENETQQRLMAENQTAGIRSFVRQDAGELSAAIIKARQELEAASAQAQLATSTTTASITALAEQVDALEKLVRKAQSRPEMDAVLKAQLGVLIEALRAQHMAAASTNATQGA